MNYLSMRGSFLNFINQQRSYFKYFNYSRIDRNWIFSRKYQFHCLIHSWKIQYFHRIESYFRHRRWEQNRNFDDGKNWRINPNYWYALNQNFDVSKVHFHLSFHWFRLTIFLSVAPLRNLIYPRWIVTYAKFLGDWLRYFFLIQCILGSNPPISLFFPPSQKLGNPFLLRGPFQNRDYYCSTFQAKYWCFVFKTSPLSPVHLLSLIQQPIQQDFSVRYYCARLCHLYTQR